MSATNRQIGNVRTLYINFKIAWTRLVWSNFKPWRRQVPCTLTLIKSWKPFVFNNEKMKKIKPQTWPSYPLDRYYSTANRSTSHVKDSRSEDPRSFPELIRAQKSIFWSISWCLWIFKIFQFLVFMNSMLGCKNLSAHVDSEADIHGNRNTRHLIDPWTYQIQNRV